MKITFDHNTANQNVDRATTAYRNTQAQRTAHAGEYALDISGIVMDNNAYAGHGKTTEEVMQDAGSIDVAVQRDYMTVMSNTMSGEDFDRLQKEGYQPGDMEIKEVVTIVDQIKAALVKGGTQVAGYTDDLDAETLQEITGSEAFARELCRQFEKYDIPVTKENAESAKQACDKAAQLEPPDDGTVRYMVENQMNPTIDNLYIAGYSSTPDGRQSRGYYAEDTAGYYAKKAEEYNWEQLQPQMEKILQDAGLDVTEETLGEAEWLIEAGIPLTADSVSRLHEIRGVGIPKETEEILSAVAAAIADGRKAGDADLGDPRSALEKAAAYRDAYAQISGEAVDIAVADGDRLNLYHLQKAQEKAARYGVAPDVPEQVSARRQLEEVRLMMTVEANRRLMESGYAIDTAELEDLVDALRRIEAEQKQALFGETDSAAAADKAALYEQTRQTVAQIPDLPAAVLGSYLPEDEVFTLDSVYTNGTALKNAYEAARESYEALMTAPRADMGDSIRKAFRNVDDILRDMGLAADEENRRAVRILGYNSMDITGDNLDAVKKYDRELRHAIRRMTPAATLQAIREGRNPLKMTVEELNRYLDGRSAQDTDQTERFSKFLYKLEKNHDITEQEREAYIGIYRMFRQLEKTDDAAVGSLLQENAELTFEHLLTAMRSARKQGMDYTVDDSFGGVDAVALNRTITEQIMAGFDDAGTDGGAADADTARQMLSEFYRTMADSESERAYQSEQLQQYRQLTEVEDAVIRELLAYRQPVTANSLTAAACLRKKSDILPKKLNDIDKSADKNKVKASVEDFLDRMTDTDSAVEAYDNMRESFAQMIEEAQEDAVSYVDLKTLQSCSRQLALAGSLARSENYQIPVEVDGEWTAINLKVLHGTEEEGRVTASMETAAYGRVTARFSVKDHTVSGYIVCDTAAGTDRLRQRESLLTEQLSPALQTAGEPLKAGTISILQGTDSHEEEPAEAAKAQDAGVQTADLYRIAKAFIVFAAA